MSEVTQLSIRSVLTVIACSGVVLAPIAAQAQSLTAQSTSSDSVYLADQRYDRYDRYDRSNDRYDRYDRSDDRYDRNDRYQNNSYYSDINRLYRDILGRRADRSGLRTWSNRLQNGWSLDRVRREIARGSEAQEAINRLYQQVLGRNADQSGLRHYTDLLAEGWSLREVRRDIANSRESRDQGRNSGWNRDRRWTPGYDSPMNRNR